jgi:hypothetical protein
MRRARLSGKQFNAHLQLLLRQPWLEEHSDELEDVLRLCSDESQQLLLRTLLHRFEYLEEPGFYLILEAIIAQVFDTWSLPRGQTQFVAMTWDEDADGAQMVLDSLKGLFAELEIGFKEVKLVNIVGKAIKNLDRYPNVVLIDDFVGSGTTLKNRVQHLRSAFDEKIRATGHLVPYKIYACAVACMETAKAEADSLGVPLFAGMFLRKGITGYETGRALCRAYKDMLRLEKKIKDDKTAKEFPFGYNRAEALFAMKLRKNISNSVFPVFWWPRLADGQPRKTIFHRFERT